jgi:hypothetical protein
VTRRPPWSRGRRCGPRRRRAPPAASSRACGSDTRLSERPAPGPAVNYDELFATWDRLITRYEASGPRFERWASVPLADPTSGDHDAVARAIARVGSDLLGLAAEAPKRPVASPMPTGSCWRRPRSES